MEKFLIAHSTESLWQDSLQDCLSQLGDIPSTANMGFIYVTDEFDKNFPDIYDYLKTHTNIAHWVGTIGMGVCCSHIEYNDVAAIVIMIAEFPENSFKVFQKTDDIIKHLKQLNNDGLNIGIVHGDPHNNQMPELIKSFPTQLGNGYLLGGLTSSRGEHYQLANGIEQGHISGVVFSDNVPIITGLSQGCTPLSEPHMLTECEGNIAIKLDNRPALDVFQEDIGEVLAQNLKRTEGYIFAGFPISGSDTRNYLVRPLTGFDQNNRLLGIGDKLIPHTPIMFCRRDSKTAVQDFTRMLEQIKKRINGTIKGALYFSCLGRGKHMFGEINVELEMIATTLGDIPLVGFYANGEISGDQLYGYTGVLTLFV